MFLHGLLIKGLNNIPLEILFDMLSFEGAIV
jgi:hypothetical protein